MSDSATTTTAAASSSQPEMVISEDLIARVKTTPAAPIDVESYSFVKRAPTAYGLFGKHARPIINAAYAADHDGAAPDLGTMTRMLAQLWKTYSEAEQAPFVQVSEQLKARAKAATAVAAAVPAAAAVAAEEEDTLITTQRGKGKKAGKKAAKAAAAATAKPKRAPSAYILFCSDKRAATHVEFATANEGRAPTFGEMGKLLSAKWESLAAEEKAVYAAQAEAGKAAAKAVAEAADLAAGVKKRAPKPPSAFILYGQAVRASLRAEIEARDGRTPTFVEMGKVIGAKWNTLTAIEKKPYVDRAAAAAAAAAGVV